MINLHLRAAQCIVMQHLTLLIQWSGAVEARTKALLEAIKSFFKDNPGWE
jgi:hypothetical protein